MPNVPKIMQSMVQNFSKTTITMNVQKEYEEANEKAKDHIDNALKTMEYYSEHMLKNVEPKMASDVRRAIAKDLEVTKVKTEQLIKQTKTEINKTMDLIKKKSENYLENSKKS